MAEAWQILSDVPGIAWPALPPAGGASVLALLRQMEESQWLSPPELAALQAEQVDELLSHAYATVPFYRDRWKRRPRHGEIASLPVLTRRDIQSNFEALRSTRVPPSHGSIFEEATSGSTGAPLRVLKTALNAVYWNAFTLRDHAWHGRDLRHKLAVITTRTPAGRAENWGVATYGLVATGPAVMFDEERERDEQLAWLEQERPDILLTHGSNALFLAKRSLTRGSLLRLREVRTFGDALDPAAHDACARAWGAKVTDVYSTNEIGHLALQCPAERHYHVQSEGVVVEILDDEGRACPPGGMGRVVVTVLHNFAMPLIRYAIGDMAEAGPPCACGRGLPVISRILGRTRNLMRTRDGKAYWPYLGSIDLATLAPIRSHQFVQKSLDLVEARLIVDTPLSAEQEKVVRALFASHVPSGITIEIVYVDRFPGSSGGKYEYFVSELPQE